MWSGSPYDCEFDNPGEAMKKLIVAATIMLGGCGESAENDAASSDAIADAAPSGWVEIAHDGRTLHAYVAQPEGAGPHPAIIVIHQNRGFSDWVGTIADRVAEQGYIAIAPDLLSGTAPGGGRTIDFADSDAAREGIGALDPEQVTGDLNAAVDYLLSLPNSNGKVSVSGFCWGGSRTFGFAASRGDLEAAYVFYGTGPSEAGAYSDLGASVYCFYGGEDNRVNSTIDASSAAMASMESSYDPVIYDGAGHGFMSRGESAEEGDPNRVAMEAAWTRWAALLESHR